MANDIQATLRIDNVLCKQGDRLSYMLEWSEKKSCEYARIIWCITISIHLRFLNKGAIMRDGDINNEGSARN